MSARPNIFANVSRRLALALVAASLSACGAEERQEIDTPSPGDASAGGEEDLATIALELTSTPSDVRCVRALVSGYVMVTRTVDVSSGAAGQPLTFPGLPFGPSTVFVDAFNVTCANVLPNTSPTWVAIAPVKVELLAGIVSTLSVDLRRPTSVEGSLDFVDSPKGVFLAPAHNEVRELVGRSERVNLRLNNNSSVPFVPGETAFSGDTGEFTTSGLSNCQVGVPVPAGSSCRVSVFFTPSSPGTKTLIVKNGGAFATITGIATDPTFVQFDPGRVDFGVVEVGTQKTTTVVLKNFSAEPFQTKPAEAFPSVFTLVDDKCPNELPAGASCSFVVRFAPESAKAASGLLSVNGISAELGGNAEGNGEVVVGPDSLSFGDVMIGSTVFQNFTVTNTTGKVFPVHLGLTGDGGFHIDASTCPPELVPGDICDVRVRYTPQSAFDSIAVLSAGPGSKAAFMSGRVLLPQLTVSPTSHDFGNVPFDQTALKTFTITAQTAVDLFPTIRGLAFNTTANGTCGSSRTLAPGQSCTIEVSFRPVTGSSSSFDGKLELGTSLPTVMLRGTAVVTAPVAATLSPAAAAFGNVTVGQIGTATFTLANPSASAIPVSMMFTGADLTAFRRNGGSCGTTLAASASCTIDVQFVPTSAGARSATLAVSAGATALQTSLTGTGVVAAVPTLSPAAAAFGNVTVGQVGTATFTLSNPASSAISVSLTFTGTDPTAFRRNGGTCGGSLAASASCTIDVQFVPTSAGTRSATLAVSAGATALQSSLTGTGVAAAAPITNLVVNDNTTGGDGIVNSSQWSIQTNFRTGVAAFADRTVTITSTGDGSLNGMAWIRTAADSKTFTGPSLATFTANSDVMFLLVDDRWNVNGRPSFVDPMLYTDTGFNAVITEGTTQNPIQRPYSVWRRSVTPGSTVTLPSIGLGTAPCYLVVVRP